MRAHLAATVTYLAVAVLVVGCRVELYAACIDDLSSSPAPMVRAVQVHLDFDGTHLLPGAEDARAGTTPLLLEPFEVPPFDGALFTTAGVGGIAREQVTAGVRGLVAPYAIELVGQPPQEGGFVRVVIGGQAQAAGFSRGLRGISLMRCGPLSASGAIVLVFADTAPSAALLVATIVHEIGHIVGLSHGSNEWDNMYSFPDGRQLAMLPDYATDSACTSASYQDPRDFFPQRAGVPGVSLVWPPPAAVVAPTFSVVVAPASEVRGAPVALRVNGCLAAIAGDAPYGFAIQQELGAPELDIEVRALLSDERLGAPVGMTVLTDGAVEIEPWLGEFVSFLEETPCPGIRASSYGYLGAPRTWRATGWPCAHAAECVSGLCVVPPDGTGACASRCAREVPESCPGPASCLSTAGGDMCVPANEIACGR